MKINPTCALEAATTPPYIFIKYDTSRNGSNWRVEFCKVRGGSRAHARAESGERKVRDDLIVDKPVPERVRIE